MNNEEIEYIKSCLPEQIIYPYYKDKYTLDLLDFCVADGTKIQDIKLSSLGGLLHKTAVKKVLEKCGDGKLHKEAINYHWDESTLHFNLTLGQWGDIAKRKSRWDWEQVSRPQKNLVLQVNMSSEHDQILFDKIGKENRHQFASYCHPVNRKKSTLGWIRLDIDLEGNEVLIEEVQSDWVRDVKQLKKNLDCTDDCCQSHWVKRRKSSFEAYYLYMKPYVKLWDEILLSAALHFTKCELGISQVWYHTNQSSKHYKMMGDYSLPPVSVYKRLPEKFGFTQTLDKPSLIRDCSALKRLNRKAGDLPFYQLKLEQ